MEYSQVFKSCRIFLRNLILESKKIIPSALTFLIMKNNKKHPNYISKHFCEEKHVDFLLIGKEGKIHYALIKDFDSFMYNHTLH